MRAYDSSAMATSPRSSDGAATANGSPDTKLTAFSPEDVRLKARPDSAICMTHGKDIVFGFASTPEADPFVIPDIQSRRAHLSPTAMSFRPVGVAGTLTDATIRCSMAPVYGISYLASGSEPDSQVTGNVDNICSEKTSYGFGPIGKSYFDEDRSHPLAINHEHLDCTRRSRAFAIEEVPRNLSHLTLAGFFSRREFGTIKGPILTELGSKGKILVAFTDSREASNAVKKVHVLQPDWHIIPLTAREFAQQSTASDIDQVSDFEGQISVSVYYDSRDPSIDQRAIVSCMKELTETFGDVKAFKTVAAEQNNLSEFEIEFFDTRDAKNAAATLNGAIIEDCILEIKLHKPDVDEPSMGISQGSFSKDNSPCGDSRRVTTPGSSGRDASSLELSPTGRSTIPRGERVGLMDWMLGSTPRTFAPHQEYNRFPDPRFKNQNFVDVDRIRRGLDVRTTIMLRNIPNKIDQSMLKEIVDETSFGKYDFMYLRIDFANNCNVGYAFINFEDPIDIIDFVRARAGHNWNCFNSDKVAEISYATIQGKDCLVQKFRNSSVMLEDPSFRPKIFHTGSNPLAGTEDRFPGPDNLSKMRRSVENAEHVGLFAPRVSRDEERRRHPPFVRGTAPTDHVLCIRNSSYRRPSVLSSPSSARNSVPLFKPSWYDAQRSPGGPRTS